MDTASVEAIDRLVESIAALLPAPVDPALAPGILIGPLAFRPTGLGGLVGLDDEPRGEIIGRRLEAIATITARAAGAATLAAAVTAVTRALLAADRVELRGLGILRLHLDGLGPGPEEPAGSATARDVRFRVLFEYLIRPVEAEDVIERIPIDLEVG